MKRFAIVVATAMLSLGLAPTAAFSATTVDPTAAPSGTHVQTGTVECTVTDGVVTCSAYELAGVGKANATATLSASYTATVQCTNHGGQLVEVKTKPTSTATTSGPIPSDKNGRLAVPLLSSSAPTADEFKAMATCPNGNWTKSLLTGTIALSSFTYTLTFKGYTGAYITITGP